MLYPSTKLHLYVSLINRLCFLPSLSIGTKCTSVCTSHDVSTEFLLSIGKVKHGKCLYTYLYNITYNASLICAFNMITHHVTHPMHGP